MPSVDENVVAMQFDNKSFEKNIADTIASLDKLRQSLDISNASKTFSDISASSRGVDLSHIVGALDTISGKFSAFGAIAFSVLNTLTTKVITAGEQLIKSLSLDQVLSGYREYETNLNSIQTILSNTRADGTNLDDVNRALDTLNEYSDKTIYNFSQMARNIGTFTAAGVNLDVSVNAIKGIANLAAVSGSNSEQASSAMYQLSQALATGTLKLMDWNSVVNAGMGGEVFQKALFETGKVLGTIKDVPIDRTFEQWTSAGNSFRGSLEQGWITADVLTQTLSGFTGDMTEAQLKAIGFNDIQIAQILDMGKVAQDAATKVKTFTQLIDTVKESVGSGWSSSFRIIFGTFDEAKETFTAFNDAIGAVVSKSADARNALLQGWKDMGGRTVLIDTITLAFTALGRIISVIKAAFHDVFPKITSTNLYDLTLALYGLIHNLMLSRETLWKIRRALDGFFSLIAIGFEIVKEFGKMIFGLFAGFDGGGELLDFFARLGIQLTTLKTQLVDKGGIAAFFDNLGETIGGFLEFISPITNKIFWAISRFIGKVFEVLGITNSDNIDNIFVQIKNVFNEIVDAFSDIRGTIDDLFPQGMADRVTQRAKQVSGGFDILRNVLEKLWEIAKKVGEVVGKIAGKIAEAFSGLPQAIADAFSNVSYDDALDTVNTGFFAGLVLLVKKFLDNPFKISGSVMKGVNQALGALTGQLKAMQTDLKASALLKIAGAIAILTASLVVLSLMNSAALTKAITAMAAGMGVLLAAMSIMNKFFDPKAAAKMALLSASLLLLSSALLILALAMKIIATLSWEEIGKGFVGVAGGLLLLGQTLDRMPNAVSLGAKAFSLNILAGALIVLALAMKIFATMSWEELAKGFAGSAAGLILLGKALRTMPNAVSLGAKGTALMAIAGSMVILALAMKIFATMSWEEIAKGIAAVAAALIAIGLGMRVMPDEKALVRESIALLLIGTALIAIATAMKIMASLSWEEMARGLVGIAGALLILAGISHIMESSIAGAFAIGVMSGSLILLSIAIRSMASIGWKDMGKGLAIMAISLAALAAAAFLMQPLLPALLALGVALGVIGLAMVLFGAGAFLVATAFSIIATAGTQGVETLLGALTVLGQALPGIVSGLLEGLIKGLEMFLDALPGMIPKLGESIAAFIQVVRDNIPNFVAAIGEFITAGLDKIIELVPKFVETGFAILTGFLQGVSDNIGLITNQVVNIILNFITALTDRMPEITAKGAELIVAFLKGITDNLGKVVDAVFALVTKFIEEIGKQSNIDSLVTAIVDLINNVLNGFIGGIGRVVTNALAAIVKLVQTLAEQLPPQIGKLVDALFIFIINVIKELAGVIRTRSGEFGKALGDLAAAMVEGIIHMFIGAGEEFVQKLASAIWDAFKDAVKRFFGWLSGCPSKEFMIASGHLLMDWMANGFVDKIDSTSKILASGVESVVNRMGAVAQQTAKALSSDLDFSPTITPILDLTKISEGAALLNSMMNDSSGMLLDASYSQAAAISTSSTSALNSGDVSSPVVKEVSFTQINNSPEALSTADIYRNSRNLITLAKEELSVL